MSSSKQDNSNSVASGNGLSGSEFFKNIVPSKIFDVARVDTYPQVKTDLNRKIAELTDPATLNYTTNIAKIMRVLRDREIVDYQQHLMEAAINNVSEDTVDIDYIRIGLKLTATDIKKLLDDENGLLRVRVEERKKRLVVKKVNIGNKNAGFKNSDIKPFFTTRFKMYVDNDGYRAINVFIAESTNQRNSDRDLPYHCEIEYIPTRVSLELASFMFYQFKSVLEARRYAQLIDNALLLELHTGYIMYGVSQLFGFMLSKNNKVKNGETLPLEKDIAVETTYIGSRYNDHLIGYDKVLKENKKFIGAVTPGWELVAKSIEGIEDWFPGQVCSYRLESRRRFEKDSLRLVDISSVRSLLEDVRLVRPRWLADLSDTQLRRLIRDKGIDNCRDILAQLEPLNEESRDGGRKGKKPCFWFNRNDLKRALEAKSTLLLEALANPTKQLVASKGNYSESVEEARKFVEPHIVSVASKSHKTSYIIKTNKRAAYVEGCPGSGKTKLIVDRVNYLLAQGIKESEICVLAFTNEAAAEFNTRLSSERDSSLKGMFVGTFSSWCNGLLSAHDHLKVINAEAAITIIGKLIDSKSRIAEKYSPEDIGRRCQIIFNRMTNFDEPNIGRSIEYVAPDLVDFEDEIAALYTAYNEYKQGRCRDFNDLLVHFRNSLEDERLCKQITKKTTHLLIDEIQDTNKIQWDIIKSLYEHGLNFFCVGDPAQSMYGFRGAKHVDLDQFTKTFKNRKRFQLAKNYRSMKPLIELANTIRHKIDPKYSISVPANGSDGALPRLKACNELTGVIEWLVQDIKVRKMESVLILCRYNKQVLDIEKALKNAHIDFGDDEKIQVLTYHKGKGLEAEHCYVLDPQFSKFNLSSYKEELCNAYVALTRAKETLTILACASGSSVYGKDDESSKRSGRSIFLELPEDKLEYVD